MTELLQPDICVIGAGSAGLSVAAGAAAFGVSVVLVERAKMGGDCLNHGCVPSKALIAASRHVHAIREAAAFGVTAGVPVVDAQKVHAHVHSVIAAITPNDSVERFTALGVRVLQAEARFVDPDTVVAGDATIRARRFVIATGSSALVPPIPGLMDVPYLTNETLFDLTRTPEHLMIIGAGPIGMEMAQAHRRLGAVVTVVDGATALGRDDPELAQVVVARLRAEGIVLHENTKVLSVENRHPGIRLHCETIAGRMTIDGSDLLVAVGRRASLAALDLNAAGIRHTSGGVSVGADLRSSNGRVYAIGDAAGGLQFTHVASYHAGLVLQQILFRAPGRENRDIVPRATFTDPELAQVGLTETEARARHGAVQILRWPYAENDRAQAEKRTEGLIKIVAGKRGRILGVGIAGVGAGEMINFWSMAISNRLSLKHVRGYIAPYPTMSEIGKRAVIAYYAPLARKPLVRAIIRFLRRFG